MRLPRLECVAAAAVMRACGPLPDAADPGRLRARAAPDLRLRLRPRPGRAGSRAATRPSERAWRTLSGRDRRAAEPAPAAARAPSRAGFPAGVWALNRLLRADFDADLSAAAITRSGIDAATELARRLRDRRPPT